jgi:flagellar basal body-associated protein FliL
MLASITPVLGLGGLYILLIALIPIVLIVLVGYSLWQLRKDEGWEQQ